MFGRQMMRQRNPGYGGGFSFKKLTTYKSLNMQHNNKPLLLVYEAQRNYKTLVHCEIIFNLVHIPLPISVYRFWLR